MIRRPPRSTLSSSSAASDVYKRQLPDANSILRVAGPITTQMFCFTGASWYNKIERLLRTALAPSLDDIGDILDGGCGCARIARFFPTAIRHRLYGCLLYTSP